MDIEHFLNLYLCIFCDKSIIVPYLDFVFLSFPPAYVLPVYILPSRVSTSLPSFSILVPIFICSPNSQRMNSNLRLFLCQLFRYFSCIHLQNFIYFFFCLKPKKKSLKITIENTLWKIPPHIAGHSLDKKSCREANTRKRTKRKHIYLAGRRLTLEALVKVVWVVGVPIKHRYQDQSGHIF